MAVRQGSKGSNTFGDALAVIVLILLAGSAIFKINLTSLVFGVISPSPSPGDILPNPTKPAEVQVEQPAPQAASDGFEHYTDKNGNEVVIVPARYEMNKESVPTQTAPTENHSAVPPLAPQPATQIRNAPVQAAPSVNLASVAMNAAAKAHTGMNVFESCRCNNGLATKGDSKQEVLEKCAQPAGRFYGNTGCREIWLYNFGPNEFMQGVCFDGNSVSKVLSLDHGY